MSDNDLIRTLTQDAAGLTPEAQKVVREEIIKRNLDRNILEGIDAQQKSDTLAEIDAYCEIIQSLPCPKTGSTSKKLNATLVAEVTSFILFTNYKKKIVVASPHALDKTNNAALLTSILLGWWAIPHGIVRTIQAIGINIRSKRTNHTDSPNEYLRSFVLSHIGEITTYKNNKQKLLEIIAG